MNNKSTLLDVFNNFKSKLNSNSQLFKNNTFMKTYILPYLSRGNIVKFILFLLGVWIISAWFHQYIWERTSDDFKKKTKINIYKFINFISSIFHFVRKVVAPFTILLILLGLYIFRNTTLKILQIPSDLFIFILSLISIKNIIKCLLIIIVLTLLCFLGKFMLNRINIINTEQDIIKSLAYNKTDELNNIDNINKDIVKKNYDIKEYGLFIKKNLYDWYDMKSKCNQNKKVLAKELSNTMLLIPSIFKSNIDTYNIKNLTGNQIEQNTHKKLKELEKLKQSRDYSIQKLRAETVYKQLDEYKKKQEQETQIAKEQEILDARKRIKQTLNDITDPP